MIKTIGKYNVVGGVNEGKSVRVWLVEDPKTGKKYAAKLINLKVMTEKLMKDEIEAHKKVESPYLLNAVDAFKDDASGSFVIITEFCPGGNLSSLIKGRHIPEATIKKGLDCITKGIFALHSASIIHRSICPEHIMIGADGNWKLMLFGLTRFIKQCTKHPFKETVTVSYDAPETFQSTGFRKAADIWALGCTVYELCTNTQAYSGDTRDQVVKKICDGSYKPRPISEKIYSKDLVDLVNAMMQREIETRWTARDISKNDYFVTEHKPSTILQQSSDWIEKAINAGTKKEAHESYLKAFNVYKGIDEDLVLAKLYVKIGDTAESQDEQIDCYMKSLALHEKFGSKGRTYAKIFYKLGSKTKAGTEEKRLGYLTKAFEVYKNLGIEDVTLAKIYSALGDFAKAKEEKKKYYNEALRIFEKLKVEKEELGDTYTNYSALLEDDEGAMNHAKKAIAVYESLNLKTLMLASAYYTAGKQEKKAGKADMATLNGNLAMSLYSSLLGPDHEMVKKVAKEFNLSK